MDYYNDNEFNSYYASVIEGSPQSSPGFAAVGYEGIANPQEVVNTRDYFDEAVTHGVSYEEEDTTTSVAVSGGGGKKKKRRQKRDPNKPKGWLSSVLMYSNAHRAQVKADNPNCTFGDIARLLSAEYRNMSPEDTAFWQKAAADDRVRYDLEMASYVPSAPISGGNASDSGEEETVIVESNNAKKTKKKKDPNAPKRNLSAWQLFSIGDARKQIQAQHHEFTSNEIMKLLGCQYKALTTEQRAPFDKMARAEKERFQGEMAVYSASSPIG